MSGHGLSDKAFLSPSLSSMHLEYFLGIGAFFGDTLAVSLLFLKSSNPSTWS